MADQRTAPDIIAALDQMKAGLGTIAQVSASYYRDLIAAGCPKRLARQLVRDLHRVIMGAGAAGGEEVAVEEVSDEDVVWESLTIGRDCEPTHRGRDAAGCPVCGVTDLEPCVIGAGG